MASALPIVARSPDVIFFQDLTKRHAGSMTASKTTFRVGVFVGRVEEVLRLLMPQEP
jgi:hypothetical protein